jgi:predicted DNA-binding transcriptional regulator YafY
MMNRLDRITSILIQLQSKRIITAKEIADRFEVSNRTIYRDISTLRNAGVPIGEEEGKGYFIVEGYRLAPVSFTQEEANALIAVGKILRYHTEESLLKNYDSALFKIKSILHNENKEKAEYLDSRMGFHEPWAPKSHYLSLIQKAIVEHLKVKIIYVSKKEEQTHRIIHPYALYFNGAVWNTIGFCSLRNELREFRLDRITMVEYTSFHYELDSSFKIEAYLEERAKKSFNP